MTRITKNEIFGWIRESIKWAQENNVEAFNRMNCEIADRGFKPVSGWRWADCKKIFYGLNKDELTDLAHEVISIMYEY